MPPAPSKMAASAFLAVTDLVGDAAYTHGVAYGALSKYLASAFCKLCVYYCGLGLLLRSAFQTNQRDYHQFLASIAIVLPCISISACRRIFKEERSFGLAPFRFYGSGSRSLGLFIYLTWHCYMPVNRRVATP
ncbi:hypothetical protein GGR56DRAFT_73027 [Xylariaceae sp. FL0804]|nr:hypothetical protein GGR56DRAFT_73027 [Xylariaceae sp. FL0804]